MAINLIRKNNGVGITAFQDVVIFHLAKGEWCNTMSMKIFEASLTTTKKYKHVASGMGLPRRQFE